MSLSQEELTSRLTYSGVTRNRIVNASAKSFDGWQTFEIRINLGLIMYLHNMGRSLFALVGFDESDYLEHPKHSFDEAVDAFNRISDSYFKGSLLENIGISHVELSKNQQSLFTAMSHAMESFVVAHELGHVATNIMPEAALRSLGSFLGGFVEVYLKTEGYSQLQSDQALSKSEKHKIIEALAPKWTKELLADHFGVEIVCSSVMQDTFAFAGCEIFFSLLYMLEEFYFRNRRRRLSVKSHPPARFRLGTLRGLAHYEDPIPANSGLQPFTVMIDELADRIMEALGDNDGSAV